MNIKEHQKSNETKNHPDNEEMPPMFNPSGKLKSQSTDEVETFSKVKRLEKEASDLGKKLKYQKALKKYNEAIVTTDPSALLLANRGDILYQLGQLKAAMRDCNYALCKNPDR